MGSTLNLAMVGVERVVGVVDRAWRGFWRGFADGPLQTVLFWLILAISAVIALGAQATTTPESLDPSGAPRHITSHHIASRWMGWWVGGRVPCRRSKGMVCGPLVS